MIKSKVVDLIKSRLGNRTEPGLDTRINNELDQAQYECENHGDFTAWFLLSESASYSTTAGEQRVPIPTDMIMEYEEGALFYNGTPLEKYEYEALRKKYYGLEGEPEAYALMGDYFYIFPTPDATYSIDMKYYQQDTLCSVTADDAENLWLAKAADWLLAKAGLAIARYIKDTEAAALFTADEAKAMTRVHKVHVRWLEENINRTSED